MSFICPLTSSLAQAPVKLRPTCTIQICLLLLLYKLCVFGWEIYGSKNILCVCVGDRYFIGSTTHTYIVTLNSTSQCVAEISARGAAFPLSSFVNSSQQVMTNCSQVGYCQLEFVSPLVDTWHYLAVNNWLNETCIVSLQVATTGELSVLTCNQ